MISFSSLERAIWLMTLETDKNFAASLWKFRQKVKWYVYGHFTYDSNSLQPIIYGCYVQQTKH